MSWTKKGDSKWMAVDRNGRVVICEGMRCKKSKVGGMEIE